MHTKYWANDCYQNSNCSITIYVQNIEGEYKFQFLTFQYFNFIEQLVHININNLLDNTWPHVVQYNKIRAVPISNFTDPPSTAIKCIHKYQ